jgi:4-hydroxy-2-oxoheptanedioate aldolase
MAELDPAGLAVWLTTPNHLMVEIARDLGYRRFVLDIEHGIFDLDPTDRLVAYINALGLEVYAKVLGPQQAPIQQALDMGCDGVIIPHIGGLEHAREVTATAKYPPLGTRSFAGTRTARYGGVKREFYERENARAKCFPMIESKEALADVEAIMALPTVDGVFPGPSDLSLSRGRGGYANTDADRADLRRIVDAARAAGKSWIMPAWSKAERAFARELGADFMVVVDETGSLHAGLSQALKSD